MTAPVNNPAGGARSPSPVAVGFVGWDTSYFQTAMGKGTFFVGADHVPVSMGGVPLVVGDPYIDGDSVSHYGDYVSGPLAYWIDADGYWADAPNGSYVWLAVVDWGDGTRAPAGSIFNNGSYGTHVYAANGTYAVQLWSFVAFPPSPNPYGSNWVDHIPTDYYDGSLWWNMQLVETFEVVADDGYSYQGYSGPQTRLGVSVAELMETGTDDSYHPFAALMSVPFSQVQTGVASGDSPDSGPGLSPPIGIGDPNSYWPGELVRPFGAPGGLADIGGNNDLAGLSPPELPSVDGFSQVRIASPDGTRSGFAAGSDFQAPDLLGADGSGTILYTGNDALPTPVHFYDDIWNLFWLGKLDPVTGADAGVRIRVDDRLRLLLGGYEFEGTWQGPYGPEARAYWRGVYSDREVLLEVGDGLIFIVDTLILNEQGQATEWKFLTDLAHLPGVGAIGERRSLSSGNFGRGYRPRMRGDGGFWLLTTRSDSPTDTPHFPVHSVIVGIGRDGSVEVELAAPSGSYGTFNSRDFPDLYGSNWSIYEIAGDPVDHDVVYASSSYLEPYPEYRASTPTGYDPPRLDPNNHWIQYVRRVSAVFRCGADIQPALWLQQPHWFSTDGRFYPDHVREMSIYISSIYWTDAEYSGGHWTGPTRVLPNVEVGESLQAVIFE